ncbi:DUF3667 domain-containing protein [uncultured Winogradskyella sp.]|uniref:DUF3667 domain-containing protein n=1 Tax=uncultured Winogradskyella sp. TaxID=395353 RepID=UPI00260C976F|nr:DUF3667 domain-containing protein [uncultured Winogradskyella sp.]|tara:strand:- start:4469 stop:5551 length:1083 start_codon:yes stop_codon:yes gene_type:complete
MKTNQTNCKNCEQPYDEGFQFCPHCGQKTNDELTIGVLFYNTISNYFSFDARFFKSFIPLLFKPGYLAKEFIKGKRLLYLHPAQMYLFISVVFFFIFSFNVRDQVDSLNDNFQEIFDKDGTVVLDSVQIRKRDSIKYVKDSIARKEIEGALRSNKFITGMSDNEIDSIIKLDDLPKKNDISFGFNEAKMDSLISINASDKEIYESMGLEEEDGWFMRKLYTQILKFYKARDGGNVLKTFYDTIPIALFFLLPIFALIIKLLYFRKGRYAHHLVFSFYYFSYLFTVFSIIFGVNLFWDIPDWIDWLIALSTFVYLLIALKKFYGQGWFLTFFKVSVATFTFMIIVIPTAVFIIGLFAFMFY